MTRLVVDILTKPRAACVSVCEPAGRAPEVGLMASPFRVSACHDRVSSLESVSPVSTSASLSSLLLWHKEG